MLVSMVWLAKKTRQWISLCFKDKHPNRQRHCKPDTFNIQFKFCQNLGTLLCTVQGDVDTAGVWGQEIDSMKLQ